MLDKLSFGPPSVSGLAAPLGIMLTAVAQNLPVLEGCRQVRVRTSQIDPEGFDVMEQWIRVHRWVWEHGQDQLGDLPAGKGK